MAEELLQKRVVDLERIILGNDKQLKSIQCIDTLVSAHNELQSATASREKIVNLFSKIDQLEKYLDPEYGDEISLTDSAKLELILSEEDRIRQIADYLQKIEDLKYVLDSEHIKAAPTFSPKFYELAAVQLQQEEECERFSERVHQLFDTYNKIIRTLSQQFVLWDEILTKAELAQQIKK